MIIVYSFIGAVLAMMLAGAIVLKIASFVSDDDDPDSRRD